MSGIATGYCGLDSGPQHWISPGSELHLLRNIQVALTNVHKHAQASRVNISITMADRLLNLTVADNGSSFADVAGHDRFGFGLRNVRERVDEMNGSFSIISTPESGTALTVQAPLTGEGVSTMKILLVDDHPLFCNVMRNLLEAGGITVVGIARMVQLPLPQHGS